MNEEEDTTYSILHTSLIPTYTPIYSRIIRRSLLSKTNENPRDYLKQLFRSNDSITILQFKNILKSLELLKYIEENEEIKENNATKLINSIIKNIELKNENEINYNELCLYLWNNKNIYLNKNIIIITRRIIIETIGDKIILKSKKSKKDDLYLTEAFAKKIGIQLVRGSLLSTRHLRKGLPRFINAYVGEELSNESIEQLINSLDSNSDGVVSPREFKLWLFSDLESESNTNSENNMNANLLDGDETDTDLENIKQPVADTPPIDYIEENTQDEIAYGGDDEDDNLSKDHVNSFMTPEIEAVTPGGSEHGTNISSLGVSHEQEMTDRHGEEMNHTPKKSSNTSTSSCCHCVFGNWGFKVVYEPVGE